MEWQLQDAKNQFSKVVQKARNEGPQEITRRVAGHWQSCALLFAAKAACVILMRAARRHSPRCGLDRAHRGKCRAVTPSMLARQHHFGGRRGAEAVRRSQYLRSSSVLSARRSRLANSIRRLGPDHQGQPHLRISASRRDPRHAGTRRRRQSSSLPADPRNQRAGLPDMAAYPWAKAGLMGLVKGIAADYGAQTSARMRPPRRHRYRHGGRSGAEGLGRWAARHETHRTAGGNRAGRAVSRRSRVKLRHRLRALCRWGERGREMTLDQSRAGPRPLFLDVQETTAPGSC